eukprot:PhM_4_TR2803/c0_g1_i1/m.67310
MEAGNDGLSLPLLEPMRLYWPLPLSPDAMMTVTPMEPMSLMSSLRRGTSAPAHMLGSACEPYDMLMTRGRCVSFFMFITSVPHWMRSAQKSKFGYENTHVSCWPLDTPMMYSLSSDDSTPGSEGVFWPMYFVTAHLVPEKYLSQNDDRSDVSTYWPWAWKKACTLSFWAAGNVVMLYAWMMTAGVISLSLPDIRRLFTGRWSMGNARKPATSSTIWCRASGTDTAPRARVTRRRVSLCSYVAKRTLNICSMCAAVASNWAMSRLADMRNDATLLARSQRVTISTSSALGAMMLPSSLGV